MFSLIFTTTRPDTSSDEWWIQKEITDKAKFTDEEYDSTIKPYWDWVHTLPGFISVEITYPDDLIKKVSYDFDTESNATSAFNLITYQGGKNTNQHELAKNKRELSHSKMEGDRANVIGTVSIVES
jgi:hypothetical protein